MIREEIRVCVLRVGGTNCDIETKRAFEDLDVKAEIVRMNSLVKGDLLQYDVVVFPGGFSYGDHVRAGAIWGKEIVAKLKSDLEKFVEEERPVLGICNGFQVLIESGLLPEFSGISDYPEAALAPNTSMKYECRWVHLKHENLGKCVFTKKIPKSEVVYMQVGHAEGRFVFPKDAEDTYLERLQKGDQLVFRYCDEQGNYANGKYPTNPNGAFYDIAGICNRSGNVFGLMPHPERAYYGWQLPDWTKSKTPKYGDGKLIFESVIKHLIEGF